MNKIRWNISLRWNTRNITCRKNCLKRLAILKPNEIYFIGSTEGTYLYLTAASLQQGIASKAQHISFFCLRGGRRKSNILNATCWHVILYFKGIGETKIVIWKTLFRTTLTKMAAINNIYLLLSISEVEKEGGPAFFSAALAEHLYEYCYYVVCGLNKAVFVKLPVTKICSLIFIQTPSVFQFSKVVFYLLFKRLLTLLFRPFREP